MKKIWYMTKIMLWENVTKVKKFKIYLFFFSTNIIRSCQDIKNNFLCREKGFLHKLILANRAKSIIVPQHFFLEFL